MITNRLNRNSFQAYKIFFFIAHQHTIGYFKKKKLSFIQFPENIHLIFTDAGADYFFIYRSIEEENEFIKKDFNFSRTYSVAEIVEDNPAHIFIYKYAIFHGFRYNLS